MGSGSEHRAPVLCDEREGWGVEGSGKDAKGDGDMCILIADSSCYKAETNTVS